MISIFASVGITPAYAGNTKLSTFSYPYSRDHPRIRGEHGFTAFTVKISLGSPPHTRGTRYLVIQLWSPAGITPAYAGNTASVQLSLSNTQDHPRLRGEHLPMQSAQVIHRGSPPLTRGTLKCYMLTVVSGRITPAYAGNTEATTLLIGASRDHPRLRGEHYKNKPFPKMKKGSPPLTRGTLSFSQSELKDYGITPAYAGNTNRWCERSCKFWDHPRLRGEHRLYLLPIGTATGSPPLTRGTQAKHHILATKCRITPAYAGNTYYKSKSFPVGGDHPRLRGEHNISLKSIKFRLGSPPLTRGTLPSPRIVDIRVGITPAYAGNTIGEYG